MISERSIPNGGNNAATMAGENKLFMQLKIICIDKNESGGFFKAEAGVNGTMKPIFCIDNTRDEQREDEEAKGSGKQETSCHFVRGGGAEEEKVNASDDG